MICLNYSSLKVKIFLPPGVVVRGTSTTFGVDRAEFYGFPIVFSNRVALFSTGRNTPLMSTDK